MRLNGILPENAPDPRVEQIERLKLMPIPVMRAELKLIQVQFTTRA